MHFSKYTSIAATMLLLLSAAVGIGLLFPGPSVELPSGKLAVLVDFKAELEDSSGAPWVFPTQIVVTGKSGYMSTATVTPNALGELSLPLYLQEDDVFATVAVSMWGDPTGVALRTHHGPFLAPYEGTAAFGNGVPSGSPTSGGVLDLGLLIMAEPPAVGTISLTAPTAVPLTLHVADATASQIGHLKGGWFNWAEPVSVGAQSWTIYSWSSAGFWNFELRSLADNVLSHGYVRRNSIESESVRAEFFVTATVNLGAYPSVRRLMFVSPEDHQPNPARPSGSDVSYETLYSRSSSTPIDRTSGQILGNSPFGLIAEELYAQLWGLNPATSQLELLAWQHLASPSGTVALSF